MRNRTGAFLIFAASAAALAPARPLAAAGTIQTLSALPSPAAPNQDVTLTLSGSGGPCRATLFFGDGATAPLVVPAFPMTFRHRYAAAGMFFARALGRPEFIAGEMTNTAPPPCVGGGDLALSVLAAGAPSGGGSAGGGTPGGGTPGGGSPAGGSAGGSTGAPSAASSGASAFAAAPVLARAAAPTHTPTPSTVTFGGAAFASQNPNAGAVAPDLMSPAFQQLQNPTIKKVTDDSQATPGGAIGVEGAGFGTWTVNRRMILRTGGRQVDLRIVNWGDNAAAGTVPDDFVGVPDGAATIQLVNGIKRPTNEMALSFVAARETVEIVKRPVGIRGCYAGLQSICNGWSSDNSGGFQDLDSAPSVEVVHGCTHWDVFHTGDDGGDTFEVQLKNGWTFEDAKVEKVCGTGDLNYSGNCYLIERLSVNVVGRGKPVGSIATGWHVPRLYTGAYRVHVFVTGPAGVPYQ